MPFQSDKTRDSPEREVDDVEMSTEDQNEVHKEWQDTTSSVLMGNNSFIGEEPVSSLYILLVDFCFILYSTMLKNYCRFLSTGCFSLPLSLPVTSLTVYFYRRSGH